jgi:hypothetical protein
LECAENCTTCTGGLACLSCGGSLFLNNDRQCSSCPDYCASCVSNGQVDILESSICLDCQTGYYISRNGSCTQCPNDCHIGCYNQNSCILELLSPGV